MEWTNADGKSLTLMEGNITTVPADAIANAANSALAGGWGVDGAIHRAGGPSIMEELAVIRARIGKCATGSAVVTGAGNLPAKYVFHAVGPVYRDGRHGEPDLLASCYRTCLALAEEREVSRITFPSISTGAYGYPIAEAAEIAVREVLAHLNRQQSRVREAVFVLFGREAYEAYSAALRAWGGAARMGNSPLSSEA
jgi:O-acetyl-ADP-ribose deacetylase (regulator of RNase III)